MVVFDRFVDALWDDDRMPRTARNVLQQAVSGLWQIAHWSRSPAVREGRRYCAVHWDCGGVSRWRT
ncbi:MAG TPA: hypothetical protein VF106_20675 [Actinophytocola sp.]